MYDLAEKHLRRAIERLSAEYTRPGNTEAYYHLGLTLKGQGRFDEAYETFFRAAWDYAFSSAAHYQLAVLSCRKNSFAQALEHIDQSLNTNSRNTRAMNLKATILRKLGRYPEAMNIAKDVLSIDPLDFPAMNELYLLSGAAGKRKNEKRVLNEMTGKMRGDVQAYLELATDYMDCGFLDEAIDVLSRAADLKESSTGKYPMVYYYLGYLYEKKQMADKAEEYRRLAAQMPSDYCFPFRHESMAVLKSAIGANSSDAMAFYYLGNLMYDIQPDKAIEHWKKSAALDPKFAPTFRNLGWGYRRHEDDNKKAIGSYEKAISLKNTDATYYMELDDLYDRANTAIAKRLRSLENNNQLVESYKPLLIRKISLLIKMHKFDKAIELLVNNQFYTSEGGGRMLRDAHVDSRLLSGLRYMKQQEYSKALADFLAAGEYPENLAIEVPKKDRRAAQVAFNIAAAYSAMGNSKEASVYYNKAAETDVPSDWSQSRFYKAMALKELGQSEKADEIFEELVTAATKSLSEEGVIDFFAKFGEQESAQTQRAENHYELGLGLLGQGEIEKAKVQFEQALTFNVGHTWARYQLSEF
jgi:tetratricopeptide (TPR) repeat protein